MITALHPWEKAEVEEMAASGAVTRVLLVLGSLLCVFFLSFQNEYFPGASFSCFHTFYLSLVFTHFISLVLSQCAQFVGGVLPSSPTFGPGHVHWMPP